MSFLTTVPEELLAAAAQLGAIGSSLTAQNAGAAAPTTAIAPAAADQVSQLQAGIFSSYGTMYQQIAAQAQAMQEQFVNTLGLSSGTYSAAEASNAAASGTSSPVGTLTSWINNASTFLGGPSNSVGGNPFSLSGNGANFMSYESGNWASAMSDCLGMAGGGLIDTSAGDVADVAGAADLAGTTTPVGAPMGGMGAMAAMPAAGMGQATMVGKLSVPPSWAGAFTPGVSPATAVQTVGWTAAAPQAGVGTLVPGMPGLGAAGRTSAGFGAPRYGVKPIVMPKPTAV